MPETSARPRSAPQAAGLPERADQRPQRASARSRIPVALVGILLAAVAYRVGLIATTVVVHRDAGVFIEYARHLPHDPLAEIREQDQHPLYPALLLATQRAVTSWLVADRPTQWILAGQIVSVVSFLAAVGALVLISRRLFTDPRISVIAGLFLALAPRIGQVTSSVLSDATHLALYLWSIALAASGLARRRTSLLLAAGALSGAAYLARPEGGAAAVATVIVLLTGRQIARLAWRLRAAAAVTVGVLTLASPYMLLTGTVVKKKSLTELFGLEEVSARSNQRPLPPAVPAAPPRSHQADTTAPHGRTTPPEPATAGLVRALPRTLGIVVYQWIRESCVVFFLLALGWLFARRHHPADGPTTRLLLAGTGLHLVLTAALVHNFGYLEPRHMMVASVLILPFAAATWLVLTDRAADRLQWAREHPFAARSIAMLVVFVPLLPWLLRPVGRGNADIVRAAAWIRRTTPPNTTIVTDLRVLAIYADRPSTYVERHTPPDRVARRAANVLPALYVRRYPAPPADPPPAVAGFVPLFTAADPDTGRWTCIYRPVDSAAPGAGAAGHSPGSKAARNASCGILTRPTCFIRFLPSFCFSSSFRLRVTSPP